MERRKEAPNYQDISPTKSQNPTPTSYHNHIKFTATTGMMQKIHKPHPSAEKACERVPHFSEKIEHSSTSHRKTVMKPLNTLLSSTLKQ